MADLPRGTVRFLFTDIEARPGWGGIGRHGTAVGGTWSCGRSRSSPSLDPAARELVAGAAKVDGGTARPVRGEPAAVDR